MYLGSKDYKIFLYISVSVSLKNSRSWVISPLVRRYFLGLRAFKLLSLNLRRTVWTVAVTLSPLLSWVAVIKGFLAPSFRLPFKVKSIHIHFCRTLQKTLNFHIFFFFWYFFKFLCECLLHPVYSETADLIVTKFGKTLFSVNPFIYSN